MFGFTSNNKKKRDEVQRILLARTNRVQLRNICGNNRRAVTRTACADVLWTLPCISYPDVEYGRAFPTVTEDISAQGISFIHNAPILEPRVIVSIRPGADDRRFLLCTVKHCTPLEHGF